MVSHVGAWPNRELGLQASSLEPPKGGGGGEESKEVGHVTGEALSLFFFSFTLPYGYTTSAVLREDGLLLFRKRTPDCAPR